VFWSSPAERWTSQRIWSGESLPPDHALADQGRTAVEIPALKRNAAAN
jgi:hypothetical protein